MITTLEKQIGNSHKVPKKVSKVLKVPKVSRHLNGPQRSQRGIIHRKELSMKKEKLEEFFNNINNAEDLVMYHLFKRGWKFVNVFKSGIMTKGNVFFVIKKYANTNTYDNFMFTENDLDITQINSIQDLKNTDIPLRKSFSPVNTDKCSWYVSYKDKIVEKGSITQSHIFLRSQMEGKEPVKPDNVKKIEKFQEMIDLIDSYASMPDYALAKHVYVEKIVKNKMEKRYVFKQETIDIHESAAELLQIYFKCISDTPIHIPMDKYLEIEHACSVLGFKKVDETDTQVKLKLPIRKEHYYRISNVYTLHQIEQALPCEVKESSKGVKMLDMIIFSPDLPEFNNSSTLDLNSLKHIYLTPDMLDMLTILSSFETGRIVEENILVDNLAMVREDTDLLYDTLPKELDSQDNGTTTYDGTFFLSGKQKEVVFKALNGNLNYTALLDNTIDQSCYDLLLQLLEEGMQPLQLIGKDFSPATLKTYLSVLKSGFDLDLFIDLPCDEDALPYYAENISKSINVECEELIAEGYSQEQISYIRRAKSRKEDYTYISKEDTLIQLWLKEYMHKNDINSSLCNELINSYKGTDNYTEIRFSDLAQDSLKEIAAHLFSEDDFSLDGISWSKLQQYILTKSSAVCCGLTTGLRIKIFGNLLLDWDDNSITFYELNKPLYKIVFVNNKAIVSKNRTAPKITDYLELE